MLIFCFQSSSLVPADSNSVMVLTPIYVENNASSPLLMNEHYWGY